MTELGIKLARNGNWLSEAPIGQWHGVSVDKNGRLTSLDLSDNSLAGKIPPELGGLANLNELRLQDNKLTGEIPPDLGRLTNLNELRLQDNKLTGEIPPELGRLTNLNELRLQDNKLTGEIPPELSNLTNLRILNVGNNQLTGQIPMGLVRLANLADRRMLYFTNTQLSLPPDKSREALASIYYATNGPRWSDQTNWLRDDVLIRDWQGVATDSDGKVVGLTIGDDNAFGEIPPEVGALIDLEYLIVSGSWLGESTAAGIGNLSKLQTLLIVASRQVGVDSVIPAELGNLKSLQYLKLTGHNGSGGIPPELGNLAKLRRLDLSNNQLNGGIPPALGSLTQLQSVNLEFNQLTGTIPKELDNIPVFRARNQLDVEPANSKHDESVMVSVVDVVQSNEENWGSDQPLGQWIGVAVNSNGRVTGLRLRPSSGFLPADLAKLSELRYLSVSGDFEGEIPPELGGLSELRRLELFSIKRGEIPPELGNLTNLHTLSLWGETEFDGNIPKELGKLANLRDLYISGSKLEGEIPLELANLTNLQYLHLGNNRLSGSMPPGLGNLTNLRSLNLENNRLSGEIPPDLSNLTNLRYLRLNGNRLTGCISPELAGRLLRVDSRHNVIHLPSRC